jgi:hypothetical protein
MTADRCGVLTRKIHPAEHAVRFTALDPADGPQAVTLDQHRHSVQKDVPIGAQGFKESSLLETKGLLAGGTVIPVFDVAMNSDVLATDFCKVSTSFVLAPLLLVSHHPSPLIKKRGNGNMKTAFHGLKGHHPSA